MSIIQGTLANVQQGVKPVGNRPFCAGHRLGRDAQLLEYTFEGARDYGTADGLVVGVDGVPSLTSL